MATFRWEPVNAAVVISLVVLGGLTVSRRGRDLLAASGFVVVFLGLPILGALVLLQEPGVRGAGYLALGLALPVGLVLVGHWEAHATVVRAEVPGHARDDVARLEAVGFPLVLSAKTRAHVLMFQRAGDPFAMVYVPLSRTVILSSLLAGRRGCLTTAPRWLDPSHPGELLQVIEDVPLDELIWAHLDGLRFLDAQGLVVPGDAEALPHEHLEALVGIERQSLTRPIGLIGRIGFIGFGRLTRRLVGPLADQPGIEWRIAELRAL